MRFKRFLNKNIVAGLSLILFSVLVIWEAQNFAAAAKRFRGISPALFPKILAVSLIVLACILIIRGLREGKNWKFSFNIHDRNSFLALGFVVGTFLYGLTIEYLGFLVVTTLYTLVFILWMKGAKPLKAFIISCITAGVIYYVFHKLMFVPLPQGEIFSWLAGS